MIEVKNLRVQKCDQTICNVSSFAVAAQQRVAVVGSNGSGKTTLLRVLAGLEENFIGDLCCDIKRGDIGFVHQNPLMFKGSVQSNICYGLKSRSRNRRSQSATVTQMLELFGIEKLANIEANAISGGEKKRVAVARALAVQPKLLLLDEPFAELDDVGVETMSRVIASQTDMTVILTSPLNLNSAFIDHVFRIDE